MAGWRDNLLEAKLDGVPFLYKSVQTKIGRRGELHEFAGRDDPFAEDLGRRARKYVISAFVIGENYASNRDALADVVEAGGDHILTHPYRGDFQVKIIDEITITESDDEGRFASFELTLVESGFAFPVISIDTAQKILFIVDDVNTQLAVKTKFSLLGAIGAVFNSVAAGFQAASSAIRGVNGKIGAALDTVDNVTSSIREFENELNTLLNTPTALMNTFIGLGTAMMGLIKDFQPEDVTADVVEDHKDLAGITLAAIRAMFDFVSDEFSIPTPTEQSQIEVDAHLQMTNTLHAGMLANGVAALASVPLDSANQAQSINQELGELFDGLLGQPFDTAVIESLATLKSATAQHFSQTAANLPKVFAYTPPATTVALVLAHQLQTDVDDLIRRNKIRHPVFTPGGHELEVLPDD